MWWISSECVTGHVTRYLCLVFLSKCFSNWVNIGYVYKKALIALVSPLSRVFIPFFFTEYDVEIEDFFSIKIFFFNYFIADIDFFPLFFGNFFFFMQFLPFNSYSYDVVSSVWMNIAHLIYSNLKPFRNSFIFLRSSLFFFRS